MRSVIEFLFYFLLLWGAALLVFGVKIFSFDSPLLLFVLMLGVGFALALIGKRWGRGMLLLAIPMAVLLAQLSAQRLWPPIEAVDNQAQVYRLTPGLNAAQDSLSSAYNPGITTDNNHHEAPAFDVQSRRFVPECTEAPSPGVEIKLLAGASLHPIACGLKGIKDMLFATKNNAEVLFASLPDAGMVYRLERQNNPSSPATDNVSRRDKWRKRILRSDLDRPMGMGWHAGSLYVATRTAVVKFGINASTVGQEPAIETVVTDLPPASSTEYRSLSIADDGTIYLSIGAGDAKAQELEWQRAGVLRITSTGEMELFAAGLYHVRDLVPHPQTGALWALEDSPRHWDFIHL